VELEAGRKPDLRLDRDHVRLELEEAARIDGASRLRSSRHSIHLPRDDSRLIGATPPALCFSFSNAAEGAAARLVPAARLLNSLSRSGAAARAAEDERSLGCWITIPRSGVQAAERIVMRRNWPAHLKTLSSPGLRPKRQYDKKINFVAISFMGCTSV
jgi:hypothetical protein